MVVGELTPRGMRAEELALPLADWHWVSQGNAGELALMVQEQYSYPDAQLNDEQIPDLRYHVCPPQHLSNL